MRITTLLWNMIALLVLLLVAVSSANASGFALMEQGVREMGSAYAGAAAEAESASTIFFNPAGMTYLSGHRIEVDAHMLFLNAKFKDDGSTSAVTTSLDAHNNDGGNAGTTSLVPNLYYAHSISDKLKLGLGITVPYGMTTEYDRNWVGRYHAVKSGLSTININPAVAYSRC